MWSAEQQQGVDVNVLVVEDDHQRGPAWARNRGLARSDARYVAYLDADDTWAPNKLQRQIQAMKEEDTGLCVAAKSSYDSTTHFIIDVALEQVPGLTSSIVIDTDQVSARWDEDLYRREDHLYMLQSAAEAGVVTVDSGLFWVEKHKGGLSGQEDKERKIEAHREFWKKAVETCGWLRNIRRRYWSHCYHRVGRDMYYQEDYRRSAELLARSLVWRPSLKTFGALGISMIKWLSPTN